MRSTPSERLETLRKRRAALDAQLTALEARERASRRKDDTRRKILVGAVMMQEMEDHPDKVGAWVRRLLAERLAKPRDRALFDLPPLPGEVPAAG